MIPEEVFNKSVVPRRPPDDITDSPRTHDVVLMFWHAEKKAVAVVSALGNEDEVDWLVLPYAGLLRWVRSWQSGERIAIQEALPGFTPFDTMVRECLLTAQPVPRPGLYWDMVSADPAKVANLLRDEDDDEDDDPIEVPVAQLHSLLVYGDVTPEDVHACCV